MAESVFIKAEELAQELGISKQLAYKMIHKWNDELKKRGITILYISHKMDKIFRIADYITVMRDGKHIRTAPVS